MYNLYDGLKEREDAPEIFEPLAKFYRQEVRRQYQNGVIPGMTVEPKLPEELLAQAKEHADLAVVVISRFSGEGWDRKSVAYEGAAPFEIEQASQGIGSISKDRIIKARGEGGRDGHVCGISYGIL